MTQQVLARTQRCSSRSEDYLACQLSEQQQLQFNEKTEHENCFFQPRTQDEDTDKSPRIEVVLLLKTTYLQIIRTDSHPSVDIIYPPGDAKSIGV